MENMKSVNETVNVVEECACEKVNILKSFDISFEAESIEEAKAIAESTLTSDVELVDVSSSFGRKKEREALYKFKDNVKASFIAEVKRPVSNTNKIKYKMEAFAQDGKRTWVTKYQVLAMDPSLKRFVPIAGEACATRADALKAAKEHTSTFKVPTNIKMIKEVSDDGTSIIASITYRKSKTERLGSYVYFGQR